MVIPDTFGIRGEKTIASYSFINIVEGTGTITYYAGIGLDDSAASIYTLQSTKFYSDEIEIETAVAATGGYALEVEKNYNMTILNLPLTAKGTGMVSLSWGWKGYPAGASRAYLLIKLMKVSGGVETIIGTGKTGILDSGAAGTFTKETTTLLLDLTKTHFKKGDNFRLSVECWADGWGAPGTGAVIWGQDPQNRDGIEFTPTTENQITAMQINIPLEINL